jgi:hypothetical protein
MAKRKKEKDIMDRSWTCLSSLKTFFDASKQEKVVGFDGASLTTKRYIYTLYDGQLTRKERS